MTAIAIYTDAAKNTVRRVVNRFGKLNTYNNGGFRIGCITADGSREARYFNTRCGDNFAAEAFAILKALEFGLEVEPAATEVRVYSDCHHAYGRTKNRDASKYSWVADKLASERGVKLIVDSVAGDENPADRVSRSEA